MWEALTKSAARNIFYGGSGFFLLIFLGLTAHSVGYVTSSSTDVKGLTENVARGKLVWEHNACIDCHTLLGEGAYYAPELGNVWVRYGGKEDAKSAREALKAWMKSQPSGVPGRRQMPNFKLNDAQLDDLVDFFEWTSRINTQKWPPNKAG